MRSFGGDGGYRPGVGDRPGGWGGQAIVKRSNAPNGMEVGIDFPFVCETCLGPNPYVRMVKMPPGDKLCKISGRGFQSFRWRAGPGGRWKETMVEYTVAKDKNICQACLVDMTEYLWACGMRCSHRGRPGAAGQHHVGSQCSFHWAQKTQRLRKVGSCNISSRPGSYCTRQRYSEPGEKSRSPRGEIFRSCAPLGLTYAAASCRAVLPPLQRHVRVSGDCVVEPRYGRAD